MIHSTRLRRRLTLGLAAAAIALAGLFALPALGDADPAAAQAPTGRDQTDPDVGGGLVAWSEDRGAGYRIYAKRIRDNALPIGGSTGSGFPLVRATDPISGSTQLGDQRYPALYGSELVVWSEKAPGAADYDLYAQRLFANGLPNGRPRLIVGGPGDQLYPDVIAVSVDRRGSRGYLVVYSEDTNDAGDVMGVRLTPALTTLGAPYPIVEGEGAASDPVIERDPREPTNFTVLFTYIATGETQSDIFGVRVSETGLPLGGTVAGIFPVIRTPESEHSPSLLVGTFSDRFRRGGANQSRNLLLFVRDDPTDGPDVHAQRLRANGLPVGGISVLAGGPGEQVQPAATTLSDQEWQVVYADDDSGTFDVDSLRVRFNGIPIPRVYPLVTD